MRRSLTTVIVSRGLEPLLLSCLSHLRIAVAKAGLAETSATVVIDNGSESPYDVASYAARGVRVIRRDPGICFSAACNLGIKEEPAGLYLLLNNDVLLHEDAVSGMMSVLAQDPTIGICGARLIYPEGLIQHCGLVFAPPPRGPYHACRFRPSEQVSRDLGFCQAVTAACMLIRGDVVDRLGGFDEDYHFGYEDVDFCLRAGGAGIRIACWNEQDSLHLESITAGRFSSELSNYTRFFERWSLRWTNDASPEVEIADPPPIVRYGASGREHGEMMVQVPAGERDAAERLASTVGELQAKVLELEHHPARVLLKRILRNARLSIGR